MKVVVFYATREGHTRRIADHIAGELRARTINVDVYDVSTLHEPIDWPAYAIACAAASVHIGRHEPEMIAFVKRYRTELERLDAAFVSVSLSQAGAEDLLASEAHREEAAADARRMVDVFVQETGWRPGHILSVAGALAYSKYNFVIRFVMKRIARKAGAPTDISHDYVFTDWRRLDQFINELVEAARGRASSEQESR
jgi:menaquinone-dependent protoporphyrinogen oxidase